MAALRAGAALAIATVVVIAAVQLARVDTTWGRAVGPDRLVRQLDASPAPAEARVAAAREVLQARPVDGRAYRAIALASDRPELLDIANARWPRDVPTRASLADRALAAGDADTGLMHLDALLRIEPWTRESMLPLLLPHLGDARVRDALVERLAADPPWRGAFLTSLRSDVARADDAAAVLAALAMRVPADDALMQARVEVLDRAGRHAEARAAWVASLPSAQRGLAGPVFDGGFEAPAVRAGYGWRFRDLPGVMIDITGDMPRNGNGALSIEFDDRAVRFDSVEQRLALSPGDYRLEAAALDRVDSDRPFEWRLSCRGGAELARLPLARTGDWNAQSVTFAVPADCAGQRLVLVHAARSLAERRLRGRLLIDDLGIFLSR